MASRIPTEEAELAVARLEAMLPDVRACALTESGVVIASDGGTAGWQEPIRDLWAAAGDDAESVHVATADGEVFGHRLGGLGLVAVSERFTLASLVLTDMRAILRDLKRHGSVTATGARTTEDEFVPGSHPDQSLR